MNKKLFITDMDGTLTKGSIVLEHAGFLIQEGSIKDDGSYAEWIKDRKNEKLVVAVAENYRKELIGKKIQDLHVDNFIQQALANTTNWYSTLDKLKEEKSKGSEVIIISGSANYLVQGVAKALNFDYVGSWYHVDENERLTGNVDGMFGYDSKLKWLYENVEFEKYDEIIGLGDTSSDFAIFEVSNYTILVEPTSETLRQALLNNVHIDVILHK